jgi:chemotaxis protein CheD
VPLSSHLETFGTTGSDGSRKPKLTAVEQRQFVVSEDPNEELHAILGSCVSICLFDPVRRIGGMTHTVFPEIYANGEITILNEFELLFNALMKKGALRRNLEASAVGGAHLIQSSRTAGHDLGEITLQVLKAEDMEVKQVDLGGTQARRVRFYPTTGELVVRYVGEAKREEAPVKKAEDESDITLF